jgi:hypothetical protein
MDTTLNPKQTDPRHVLVAQEPRRQGETRRIAGLGHSSNGPSWIDPAEIRVTRTESRFAAYLNRLLQQNPHFSDSARCLT